MYVRKKVIQSLLGKMLAIIMIVMLGSTPVLAQTNEPQVENVNTDVKKIIEQSKEKMLLEEKEAAKEQGLYDEEGNQLNYQPSDQVRVIVELEKPSTKSLTAKKNRLKQIQDQVIGQINKKKKANKTEIRHQFYISNFGFSLETAFKNIKEIKKIENVKNVKVAKTYKHALTKSKELVKAVQTWKKYDLKGQGMLVAVVDSGIDVQHKDFELSKEAKEQAKWTKNTIQGELAKTAVDDKWYSYKVPSGYDWADQDTNVKPNGDPHGMHVAGIVGANGDKNGVRGVAPDVQLLAEKVFSDSGAVAYEDDVVAGINHAIQMRADVINLSLGGDAGYVNENAPIQQATKKATQGGILVVAAGGNASYSTETSSLPRTYKPFAENPDIGTVGDPGVSPYALQVASSENDAVKMQTLELEDETLVPYQVQPNTKLFEDVLEKDKTYPLVNVGEGLDEDYQGKDVKGKIAVVSLSQKYGSYTPFQYSAEDHGAFGVIVIPAPEMADYPKLRFNPNTIPAVTVSKQIGHSIVERLQDGKSVKAQLNFKGTWVSNPNKGEMSGFSAWGLPTNLSFKPEITAPGGKIYSTVPDNKYKVMSGTSMAAPHVAGGGALVLQSFYNKGYEHNAATIAKAKTALMNTSKIIYRPGTKGQLPYSPRKQGAGLMQINKAVQTPILITHKDADNPMKSASVALKEIKDKTISFTLTPEILDRKSIHPFDKYRVYVDVMTDATEEKSFDTNGDGENDKTYNYLSMKSKKVKDAKVTINGKKVSEKKGYNFKVKKDEELHVEINLPGSLSENRFVEGFVRFVPKGKTAKESPPINVPYTGFYGDWDKPNNLDPSPVSGDPFLGHTVLWDALNKLPLGYNRATGNFDPEHIAVSPRSIVKGVYPSFTALRNLKELQLSIEDNNGKQVDFISNYSEFTGEPWKFRKNVMTFGNFFYKYEMVNWNSTDADNKTLSDGDYSYVLTSQLAFEGAEPQKENIPIKVDSIAPSISNIKVTPKNDKYQISWDAKDKGSGYNGAILWVNGHYYSTEPNETSNIVSEKPESIVVTAIDYAHNVGFHVWGGDSEVDAEVMIDYKRISGDKVNKQNPANITAFGSKRMDWIISIKNSDRKVIKQFEIDNEHTVRKKWWPAEDVPNGDYYVTIYVEDEAGINTTTDPYKITVKHNGETNAANMLALVREYKEAGEFANDRAVRALTMHLTAVNTYEEKGLGGKVVKHIKGFKLLLDHQKENELISAEAYNMLKAGANALIEKWQ
ncbi:hypothetical protein CFK37_18495 [Virgibacillus phasianinus]|uniref:Lactocepin n=1 Tax=Virgibacillus phasianinus TaxID=2017483 RepID=A0A220U7Q0_9BACI|nr:S8 family serine peptidase [Virgibacillus phasianinus]ASK64002.1 hypothetical protein CFK37_18495 [Virgibacillus phasianinus]